MNSNIDNNNITITLIIAALKAFFCFFLTYETIKTNKNMMMTTKKIKVHIRIDIYPAAI